MIEIHKARNEEITILANMNKQLKEDEEYDNPMSVMELVDTVLIYCLKS